jgi:hypothetical protein
LDFVLEICLGFAAWYLVLALWSTRSRISRFRFSIGGFARSTISGVVRPRIRDRGWAQASGQAGGTARLVWSPRRLREERRRNRKLPTLTLRDIACFRGMACLREVAWGLSVGSLVVRSRRSVFILSEYYTSVHNPFWESTSFPQSGVGGHHRRGVALRRGWGVGEIHVGREAILPAVWCGTVETWF